MANNTNSFVFFYWEVVVQTLHDEQGSVSMLLSPVLGGIRRVLSAFF